MAKKQSRRSVSLNKAVYEAAMDAAAEVGMSLSEWITSLIRERIPDLPHGVHVSNGSAHRDIAAVRWQKPERIAVHVPNATPEPPRRVVTRSEIEAAAATRRAAGVPSGALCANCIDAKATHIGRIDHSGKTYPICDLCELPVEKVGS